MYLQSRGMLGGEFALAGSLSVLINLTVSNTM